MNCWKFKVWIFSLLAFFTSFQTKAQLGYDELFQTDSIATLNITISENNWQFLTSDPERKDYVSCNLKGFGKELDSIGIRFKGSYGTLWSCLDEDNNLTCNKLSLKLDINYFFKDQEFYGIKKLNLHSMGRDPSKMREKLAYDFYREAGLHAPLAAWVKVKINGKNMGVYALIEQVDNDFLVRNWGSKEGYLFKEAYPNTPDTNYLKSHQKNHKNKNGGVAYLDFITEIPLANEKSWLNNFIDMEQWVNYLAIEKLINNWDGITTFYCSPIGFCFPHNYYWHLQDTKFTPIVWDVDLTFNSKKFWDGYPAWYDDVENCNIMEYHGGAFLLPSQCDGLLIFTKKFYFEEYKVALKSLIQTNISSGKIFEKVNQYQNLIQPHLKDELEITAWQIEVEKLKSYIQYLANAETNWLTNIAPPKLEIDFTQPSSFTSWSNTQTMAELVGDYNVGSSVKSQISNGNLDLEFQINPQLNGENGWATLKIPTQNNIDLNNKKRINIKLNSNWEGSLQVTLGSESYTDPKVSEYYGWVVYVDSKTQSLLLPFDEIKLQQWANVNQNTVFEEVLKSVTFIQLSPFKNPNNQLEKPIKIEIIEVNVE